MSDEQHYDLEQSRRFLRMLDPTATHFCYQLFKKTKEKDFEKPAIFLTLNEAIDSFALAQQRRWNVTVTIAETTGASRKYDDIVRLRAAFIDFDSKLIGKTVKYRDKEKIISELDVEKLINSKFPPRLIVNSSPGNYHAYWPLDCAPIGIERDEVEAASESFKDLQYNLAELWGADPGCTGINWDMRLPGWWRYKDDDGADPSLVNIVWEDPSEPQVRYNPSLLIEGIRKLNNTKKASKPKKDKEESEEAQDAGEVYSESFSSDVGQARAHDWLKKTCDELSVMYEGGRDNLLNQICWTAGGYIAGGSLKETFAVEQIRKAAEASGLDQNRINDKLNRVIAQGKHSPIKVEANIISMERPTDVTNLFLETSFTWQGIRRKVRTILFWQQDFWIYSKGMYQIASDDEIDSFIRKWLNGAKRKIKKGKEFTTIPFQAKSRDWTEMNKQVARECQMPEFLLANSWLRDAENIIPPQHCIAFPNGLYDDRDNELKDLNPGYFNNTCVTVDYDTEIKPPEVWNNFLEQIFEQADGSIDYEAIELLQEWFGYSLTTSIAHQKALLFIGPTRSGKGTIEKVFQAVLGERNIGTFDFPTLSTDFGMEGMHGKSLSVCSDVRDMTRDLDKVVERVLKIVANDPVPLNRKGKKIVNVKLSTRLMMFTNQVPTFKDAHGAMSARLLIIQMHQSFLGREDIYLIDKLLAETQQIAMWAVEGLRRLNQQGYFTEPQSSREARNELRVNDSPLVSFAEERLDFAQSCCANKDAIWAEYQEWAATNGYRFAKNRQGFFRDMVGLFGQMFSGVQSNPDPKYAPRVIYVKGCGLVADRNRETYNSTNPPRYTPKPPMRREYNEGSPPPNDEMPF